MNIPANFKIGQDETTAVVLDFDAEKSVKVTETGGKNPKYILRPVIKVVRVNNPD